MGANNSQESTQASRELLAYVRKILGPSSLSSSAVGAPSVKLPITHSGTTGQEALTNGERANGSPRQLQAEAITRPSKSSSGSSGSISLGNNWLLSPIAGVLNSVLGLFGIGSSTSQVTRYRAETRQPFEVVEEISPETGAGIQTINESTSGLFGVTSGGGATASSNATARTTGGADSNWAPAAGAEASASRSESTTEDSARGGTGGGGQPTSASWARRLTGSVISPAPRATATTSMTRGSEGATAQNLLRTEPGSGSATGPTASHSTSWANGVTAPTSEDGRSLMNDRQGLISAVRRSLSDSRGFSDVLNEFQDGL